jgi:hypothetical protein
MITYAIIDAASAGKLVLLVNTAVREHGWAPLGGVSVTLSHSPHGAVESIYAQAMTKEFE